MLCRVNKQGTLACAESCFPSNITRTKHWKRHRLYNLVVDLCLYPWLVGMLKKNICGDGNDYKETSPILCQLSNYYPIWGNISGLGRVRTYDQSVMSRPLYHWATSPQLDKLYCLHASPSSCRFQFPRFLSRLRRIQPVPHFTSPVAWDWFHA